MPWEECGLAVSGDAAWAEGGRHVKSPIGVSPFGQVLIGQLPFRGLTDQVTIDPDGRAKFAIDGFLVGAALGRGIGRGYRVT